MQWKAYRSHKIVRAAPISNVEDTGGRLTVFVKPYGDHTTETFEPSEPAMKAHARIGAYAVIYADGYKSISPKDAFESGYDAMPEHIP